MKHLLRIVPLLMAIILPATYATAQIKDGEATVTQGSTTTVSIGSAYANTLKRASSVSATWTTSNSAISIQSRTNTTCTIKGNTVGTAKLYFQCSYYIDGFRRTMNFYYDITVKSNTIPVTRIEMSPSTATMRIGETLQLSATAYPKNATNRKLKWTTENYSVASVSNNGLVTARGTGKVWVWAKATDGSGAGSYCVITVSEPIKVESIALSETEHTINVGDELTLTASVKPDDAANKEVAWLSDDTGVATVDGGVVTAIAPGTCNIQCSSTDGGNISATCRITVNVPERKWLSVVLPNGSFAIDVTDMPEIDLKVAPDNGYAVHSMTIDGKALPFEPSDSILTLPGLEHSSIVNVVFVSTTPSGIVGASEAIDSPYITLSDKTIRVDGLPQGTLIYVYDKGGALMKVTNADTFTLDKKGVYIMQIAGKSFKFAL